MSQSPKLLAHVDEARVAQAYDICLRHLNGVNVWDRRKGIFMSMALSILGSLLVVAVATVAILVWRGYL